jgi:hypothetical protein
MGPHPRLNPGGQSRFFDSHPARNRAVPQSLPSHLTVLSPGRVGADAVR